MASTLLAVDDSVTMRKVLEITFAGPDFRVVSVNTADAALAKVRSDKPDIVICDLTLEPKNGYELCKSIKQLSPATAVLLLSSKQNPFDVAKGSAAQADDHIDKPFDTQQMIDKVKKMLSQPGAAKPAGAPVAAAAPAPAPVPAAAAAPVPAARTVPAMQAAAPTPAIQRAKTLIYNPPAGAVPPPGPAAAPPVAQKSSAAASAMSPTPVTGLPLHSRGGAEPPAPAAAVASHVNGQMAGKLEAIGLTPAQVDAVLALSRDVVERVVWEVVPVLAETIIKEEITRLMK